MSTPLIHAALRARFCAPEWAIFFEVPSGTGGGTGYADAVAMNLYPSRGLEINGFEVKVSRGDWLRELKQPAKAEPVFRYCDRWWLVVSDLEIVKDAELPVSWGLLALRGEKLVQAVAAPKLKPVPIDRQFFAALARRSSRASDAEIQAIVGPRVTAAVEQNKAYATQRLDRVEADLRRVREQVHAFEQASGISIHERFDRKPEVVGAAVRFLLDGGLKSIDGTLEMMERHATGMIETIKAVRATPELTTSREVTS